MPIEVEFPRARPVARWQDGTVDIAAIPETSNEAGGQYELRGEVSIGRQMGQPTHTVRCETVDHAAHLIGTTVECKIAERCFEPRRQDNRKA